MNTNSINTLYPILFNARIISPLNTIINHTILRILLFLLHRCTYIYIYIYPNSKCHVSILGYKIKRTRNYETSVSQQNNHDNRHDLNIRDTVDPQISPADRRNAQTRRHCETVRAVVNRALFPRPDPQA